MRHFYEASLQDNTFLCKDGFKKETLPSVSGQINLDEFKVRTLIRSYFVRFPLLKVH